MAFKQLEKQRIEEVSSEDGVLTFLKELIFTRTK